MNQGEVILVKLGGSLITDKSGYEAVRADVLARLAAELRDVAQELPSGLVLGHGSGSFGHAVATEGGWSANGSSPSPEVLARTQDAAARLHREVVAALLGAGLAPFSLAPGSLMLSSKGRVSSLNAEPLVRVIGSGLLPVLFGDVVIDTKDRARIFSTESVFLATVPTLLARGIRIRGAYWLGNTEGVRDHVGNTIDRINRANAKDVVASLSPSVESQSAGVRGRVRDVTGGMLHRVESALALSRLGVPSWILDGGSEGLLARAVAGERVPGTYVEVG